MVYLKYFHNTALCRDEYDDIDKAVKEAVRLENGGLAAVECIENDRGDVLLDNSALWARIDELRESDESSC